MSIAKYYIYRNLHTGGFSIKYKGKVVDRSNTIIAENISFKVNEVGRQRVIKEHKKNVHAYVVCDKYTIDIVETVDNLRIITYNPYMLAYFTCNNNKIEIAKTVLMKNGKCYLLA